MCVSVSGYRCDRVLVDGWCVNKLHVISKDSFWNGSIETWRNVVWLMAAGFAVSVSYCQGGRRAVCLSVCPPVHTLGGFLREKKNSVSSKKL